MNIRHYFNRDLYNAVLANPVDVAPRLIFCDDLEDNGVEELPAFIRGNIRLVELLDDIIEAGSSQATEFCQLIEQQAKLMVNGREIPTVTKRHGHLGQAIKMKRVERLVLGSIIVSNPIYWDHCPVFDWVYSRCRLNNTPVASNCNLDTADVRPIELRGEVGVKPHEVYPSVVLPLKTSNIGSMVQTQFVKFMFWRGFVYRAALDMENFREFASEIYGNHPIQEFNLFNRVPRKCTRDEVNTDNYEVGGTGVEPQLSAFDDPNYVYAWYGTNHLSQAFQIYEQSNVPMPSNPDAVINSITDLQQQIEELPETPPYGDFVDTTPQSFLASSIGFAPVGEPELIETMYQATQPYYLLSYIFKRMYDINLSRTKEDQVKAGLYGYNRSTLVFDTQSKAFDAMNEALLSLASEWYQQRPYEGMRWKGKHCEGY